MALAAANLTSGTTNTDATSVDTASITPTANALVTIAVDSRVASGTANQPTATGCNLTWVVEDTVAVTNRRTTLFRGMGSPTTGVITIDFNSQTQTHFAWIVDEFTGCDTSGTNGSGAVVQNPTATSGTGTATAITLAAFGSANNMAYVVNAKNTGAAGFVPGTDFDELADVGSGASDQLRLQTEKKLNETAGAATWTGSTGWRCMAIEVKEAVAPGGTTHPGYIGPQGYF